MGTYYKATYLDSLGRDFKPAIDSLLKAVNDEISTYVPTSTISKFNQTDSLFDLNMSFQAYTNCLKKPGLCGTVANKHFYANFVAASLAYAKTNGAFDATVMPLVNYWGFGYKPHKAVEKADSVVIDSLRQFVGFKNVALSDRNGIAALKKMKPGVQLDFGGTGQGYGVDAISEFLELQGVKQYLVDVGGECRARGKNPKGEWWTVGINTPKPEAPLDDYTQVVRLENSSVSTSGNYRNFYEVNGKKYSHFISPFTGFPQQSNLLSVSVFAKDCLTPDAMATGFMVMGLDAAFEFAERDPDLDALFIYSDEQGNLQVKYTSGAPIIRDEG